MPRQPFLPTYRGHNYAIGAGLINERPQFVTAIGKCIAHWWFVEHQLAILLGVLLRAESQAAIAVFTKLRRSSNQYEAVEIAAQSCIDEKSQELLKAILKLTRSSEKERNDLVHGHWGLLSDLDGFAIWIASDHHSSWNTMVLNSEKNNQYVGHDDLQKICSSIR